MREYLRTHPWLRFELNLRKAPASLWAGLGEAQSKCDHIANTPLRPEIAKQLHSLYLAKGVRATTAIEGNTLTEEQVIQRIEKKLELPPSQEYLGQEIDNIEEACNKIMQEIFKGNTPNLTVETICSYNRIVLKGLAVEKGVVPGKFRQTSVGVGRYRAVPFEDCKYLLNELCKWLSTDFNQIPGYDQGTSILKAIIAHVYFELIHPFGDGNGRTGRLIEFHLLLKGRVPTAAAHLLSNHYNQTRTEYYRQLDSISQSKGNVLPFIEYAVRGFVDGLKEQLKRIKFQLFEVTWRNYIHEVFGPKSSKADKRRRDLALALDFTPIPIDRIPELSPQIAAAYAGKTRKTIMRDLGVLRKLQLLEIKDRTVRARREMVFAFLPKKLAPTDFDMEN